MARMNRRRTLVGVGSLVIGAGGFVASGAVSLGSDESVDDSFVQVEGTNQAVDLGPIQTGTDEQQSSESDDSTDGSSGGDTDTTDGGDEGEDDTGGDERDDDTGGDEGDDDTGGGGGNEPASTRVQVIAEPSNPGNAVNAGGPVTWNGSTDNDGAVATTADGFFGGITAPNLNRNATTVAAGTVTDSGYLDDSAAFIIANVGPKGGGSPDRSVSLSTTLYTGGTRVDTDQLQFPYRVVEPDGSTTGRGTDLFDSSVELSVGAVIAVAVVFDTNGGSNEIENVDTLRFSARRNI